MATPVSSDVIDKTAMEYKICFNIIMINGNVLFESKFRLKEESKNDIQQVV